MQRCDISIYFYWFSRGSEVYVGMGIKRLEVPRWRCSEMQVRRRWHASDHHTLIKRKSRRKGHRAAPSQSPTGTQWESPTSKRIEFLLKCSQVQLYGCVSVSPSQRVCVLSVNCPCICYFYAWFIDFILWPLDWTLNEFLNSLRSGAGLINFWFPLFFLPRILFVRELEKSVGIFGGSWSHLRFTFNPRFDFNVWQNVSIWPEEGCTFLVGFNNLPEMK